MAPQPVSLLSYRIDPAGVLELVKQLAPDARTSGTDGDSSWSALAIPAAGTPAPPFVLTHSPGVYEGAAWSEAVNALRDRCKGFPPTTRTADVMRALSCVRFRLDLGPGCVVDLERAADDERTALVLAIADHLDAFVLTPSALCDRRGRVLIGDEPSDPEAVLPAGSTAMPSSELLAAQSAGRRGAPGDESGPTATRVARRALALAAVSSRAFLEHMDPNKVDVLFERAKLLAWVDAVNLGDELEPDEWQLLQAQVSEIDERRAVDAAWRLEGLTVLAWALGRAAIPPYDRLVRPADLFPAIHFLDPDAGLDLASGATLPTVDELDATYRQLFTVHWRIREFRLTDASLDLTTAPTISRSGPLDFSGCRLVDHDLAIGRLPIDMAPPAHLKQTANIVAERLVALRWLQTGGTYSHLTP